MKITHPLEPVFDENSRVLILGTMPSPKSREVGFYYGHPQNRFWKILSELLGEDVPLTTAERICFLQRNRIALWDVLAECEIEGAQDSSIRHPVANDISRILRQSDIRAIFVTGKAAAKWYDKLLRPRIGLEAIMLPSTSPANCAVPKEKMLQEYSRILQHLR